MFKLFKKSKPEEPIDYRRTGRTTRIADNAIQTLFTKGVVTLVDHYQETSSGNDNLSDVVKRRLRSEHSQVALSVRTVSFWGKRATEIKLVK